MIFFPYRHYKRAQIPDRFLGLFTLKYLLLSASVIGTRFLVMHAKSYILPILEEIIQFSLCS